MKVAALHLTRYALPFAASFASSRERAEVRQGLLVRLVDADGVVAVGEAAPLAAFGGGTVGDAERELVELSRTLAGRPLEDVESRLAAWDLARPGAAAARCALETALLDLQARRRGLPLAGLLVGRPRAEVAVNATLDANSGPAAARAAIEQGFTCLKLKVGLAGSPEAEVERVRRVREAVGPTVALRLDANGAWSPEQAIAILARLAPLGIALIEQPVRADDLAGLAAVRAAVEVPVAADEAVPGPEAARRAIEAGAADLLIVKPMVAGGPRRALEMLVLAAQAGLGAVVTTTLDAGPAVALALHLAATLPENAPACGLATAELLVDDLIEPALPVRRGWMPLPVEAGLGVRLDSPALERWAGPWRELLASQRGVGTVAR